MNDHCWSTKGNWLLDFFPLTPPERYPFLFLSHISSALSTLLRALRQISSPNSKKQVKKYWYQKKQRFRRRLQRWMVREVLNPLREMFLSFPTLKKVPSCPPTCLCKHLAKMMIYQLLSNLELSVSWGRMPSAQYNNKVLHLTAKSLDTAAFQHSRLENVLQLCINWKGGERGKKKKKKCNELNMEMNNTLKYNLLCVILVFNSIYFMLSLHDGLAQIYV